MKHFPFTVRFGIRYSTDRPAFVRMNDIAAPPNVGAGTLCRPNGIAVHAVGDVWDCAASASFPSEYDGIDVVPGRSSGGLRI